MAEFPLEPCRIKAVEPIKMTTRAQREESLAQASYNVLCQLPNQGPCFAGTAPP